MKLVHRAIMSLAISMTAIVGSASMAADGFPQAIGYESLPHMEVRTGQLQLPRGLTVQVCHGGGRDYCVHTKTTRVRYICVWDASSLPDHYQGERLHCRDPFCAPQPDGDPAFDEWYNPHPDLRRLQALKWSVEEDRYTRFADCQARTQESIDSTDLVPAGHEFDMLCELMGRPGPLLLEDEKITSVDFPRCDTLQHIPELW